VYNEGEGWKRRVDGMATQAVVEPDDVEDMIALLREKDGPLALDALVERYVSRLKERVIKEAEAVATNV
jgi:hypothetical protein